MIETKNRPTSYKDITDEQISQAANTIFQLKQGFRIGNEDKLKEQEIDAARTLINAGRDRARMVCKSSLEKISPAFWATNQELEAARKITVNYVKLGFANVKMFNKFGLDIHIPHLAEYAEEQLPSLEYPARERLFSYESELVRRELRELHPNLYVALNKLNPKKPL